MRPAFSSVRQAGAFVGLLLVVLLLPFAFTRSLLPAREQLYSSAPLAAGSFPYIHDQIFEEKGDIDIAFMGASTMWWGIDAPQVQAQLSQELGRPATVRSLCWNTPGFDPLYFILKDLLAHRKVKLLVFSDISVGSANIAHPRAPYWFRWADNAADLNGLNVRQKASFYACAILDMPRNLLNLVRANGSEIQGERLTFPGFPDLKNPALYLGSLPLDRRLGDTFENFLPKNTVNSAEVCDYAINPDCFHFSNYPVAPMQIVFLRKLGELLRNNHVAVVCLHLPETTEFGEKTLTEPLFWPDLFHMPVSMIGIPPVKLFAGLSEAQSLKLFYNYQHFNQNGYEYFTRSITPALIKTYEEKTKP